MEPLLVCVDRDDHGEWAVIAPGQGAVVACESMEDARTIAYVRAIHCGPCEVVVRDAYHRVVSRETIGSPSGRGTRGVA